LKEKEGNSVGRFFLFFVNWLLWESRKPSVRKTGIRYFWSLNGVNEGSYGSNL